MKRTLLLVIGLALGSCGRQSEPAAVPTDSKTAGSPQPERASVPEGSAPGGGFAEPPPAAPTTVAPESADDEELETLAEAEAAFERARAELEPVAKAGAAPAARKRRASEPRASGAADTAAAQAEAAPDPCPTTCRAFSSMKRAADAICRLAGEANARCSRAKSIVGDHERRVTSCRCTEPSR